MATAFLNGVFHPYQESALPWHDAGFVFGATVTDLVRTFGKRLFRLGEHIRRFRRSCSICHVPLEASDEQLHGIAEELVQSNAADISPTDELVLVMFATPGPVGRYIGAANDGPPTLGMHTWTLPANRYERLYRDGARLVIPEIRAPAAIDPRAKQRSRMHWWIAARQSADLDPLADALLLDENGYVTETASANVLIAKNGVLLTPPAESVLPGVTLHIVQDICTSLGIAWHERRLTPADCQNADEIILTSTTFGLAGVRAIEGRPLKWPGAILARLNAEWKKMSTLTNGGE